MWYGVNKYNICRTGRATSPDGVHWKKDPLNPVLDVGPPGSWDEVGAWVPRVIGEGNRFTMYYQGASIAPFTRWNIGRATSADGRFWQKDSANPVLRVDPPGSWESDFVGPGTVLFDGSVYRMWYDGIVGIWPGISDAVGYATSADGIHWTKYEQNPVLSSGPPGSWDQNGVGYNVNVLFDSGVYHMWYTGNTLGDISGTSGIGYAISHDGIHWKKYPRNPVLKGGTPGSWEAYIYGPSVLSDASGFRMWYGGTSGATDPFAYIGYATAPRSPATIVVGPELIDFQNVHPGTESDTVHLTINSWGFTPLKISSLSHKSSAFAIVDSVLLPATVPPFGGIQLGFVCRPAQEGMVIQDTVVVISNDSIHSAVVVPLRGRGSAAVQRAQPSVMYGISSSSDALQLYAIDRSSGSAQALSRFSPRLPQLMSAFTVRQADTTMYAAFSSSTATDLYRMSSANGDLEAFGKVGIGDVRSMAFSPSDALYLVTAVGRMYRVSKNTLDTLCLGWTGHAFNSLAFNPATGVLWASVQDTVFTIDTVSGAATLVGANGLRGARSSIAFSGVGTLYGLFAGSLVAVDKISGRADWIGYTGVDGLDGIALSGGVMNGVEGAAGKPRLCRLAQNYPNPFNPKTVLSYQLSVASDVRLSVYDLLGREVAVLVNERKAAGMYKVTFDGTNISSGIYICRMIAGKYVESRKMVLTK